MSFLKFPSIELIEINLDAQCCQDIWKTRDYLASERHNRAEFVYKQNSKVEGAVRLVLRQPLNCSGIYLAAQGRMLFGWDNSDINTVNNEKHQTIDQFAEELKKKDHKIQKEYVILPRKALYSSVEPMCIPIGEHCFPFKFDIPSHIPSSFRESYGLIHYFLEAIVDPYPSGEIILVKKDIIIHGPFNLNFEPSYFLPLEEKKEDTNCCLCCTSGSFGYKVTLPKTGFARGEEIIPTFELNNMTSSTCSASIKMTRNIKYTIDDYKISEERTLHKYTTNVGSNSIQIWQPGMKVQQSLLPSRLSDCEYVEVIYKLHYQYQVNGCNCDSVNNSVEIKVGELLETQGIVMSHAQPSDVNIIVYQPSDFSEVNSGASPYGNSGDTSGGLPQPYFHVKENEEKVKYPRDQTHPPNPIMQQPYSQHEDMPPPPSYSECVQIPAMSGASISPPIDPHVKPSAPMYTTNDDL